ncbi:MAG: gliding motility-associated C-terminal domain-containing protein [Prevotella sp.]|nr:gliding motility-associated C-terminal domain-containing protein [Prevotella sp.]MCM1074262.1 gliding motility-associated C-terminal domain-containing protein [Ruminococcus sp.]
MKQVVIFLISALECVMAFNAGAASVTFSGSTLSVIEETPEKSTGLNKIFVVYDVQGVSATYHADSSQQVVWYKYSNLGGGYAEQITNISHSGRDYTLSTLEGDMGYIVEEGTSRYYFWVVNYIDHRLWLRGISADPVQDCSSTNLLLDMKGTPLHYYTINGRRMTLSQGIELVYDTQKWSDEAGTFVTQHTVKIIDEVAENLHITPPAYANTRFTLSGDKFLKQWNWTQECESDVVPAFAVDVRTVAEQAPLSDDPDFQSNVIGSNNDNGLGGSAPADITFTAECTEGVIHHEWQFANDMDFDDIEYRFNEQEVNHVFREQGTVYVRYIGSNATGECETISETYTIHIGDSELKCPNAFSPGASPGVNDEWKVSFRSIVEFECWIFNRHGEQIFHFTDPLQGWDGKHRGKLVKPGVYYYVIDAKGADGRHYKKSGDINIINFRGTSGSSSSGADTGGGVDAE